MESSLFQEIYFGEKCLILLLTRYILRRLTLTSLDSKPAYVLQVLDLLEEQLRRVEQRIDALLLVGGFSGSEYLFKRVDVSSFCLFRSSFLPLSPPSPLLLFLRNVAPCAKSAF